MTNSGTNSFITRCIYETATGLRAGLSQFSGNSRVAVIYKTTKEPPFYIYDPANLLKNYEPKLKSLFSTRKRFRDILKATTSFSHIFKDDSIRIDGLLTSTGLSSSVRYQVWFTEHHPDICSPLPILKWMKYAILRVSHDIANKEHLYTGISGHFLKEYSFQAVLQTLESLLHFNHSASKEFYIQEILEAVLGVSKTYEEGSLPHGRLAFVKKNRLKQINLIIQFPENEKPGITHYKHVRKLLQAVENTNYRLISDGHHICGISSETLFSPFITADYHGKIGFLYYNDMPISSFTNGILLSSTHQDKLVELEEILLDYELSPTQRHDLFNGVRNIIHQMKKTNYGCSILLDLTDTPLEVSSQPLLMPMDLLENHQLACNLAKVDGALHICKDMKVHGFACLLDGQAIGGEDRSRGARYNSALRFTAQNHDAVILVVSSDSRPVATIYQGMELNSRVTLPPASLELQEPELLDDWFCTI